MDESRRKDRTKDRALGGGQKRKACGGVGVKDTGNFGVIGEVRLKRRSGRGSEWKMTVVPAKRAAEGRWSGQVAQFGLRAFLHHSLVKKTAANC